MARDVMRRPTPSGVGTVVLIIISLSKWQRSLQPTCPLLSLFFSSFLPVSIKRIRRWWWRWYFDLSTFLPFLLSVRFFRLCQCVCVGAQGNKKTKKYYKTRLDSTRETNCVAISWDSQVEQSLSFSFSVFRAIPFRQLQLKKISKEPMTSSDSPISPCQKKRNRNHF